MKQRETLSFEPGTLSVRISGYGQQDYSGELIFDWSLVDHRPNEEDSGSHVAIDIPHSELIAIRDFLNRVIPLELAEDPEQPLPAEPNERLSRPFDVPVAWRRRRKGSSDFAGWTMCPEYPGRDPEFDLQSLFLRPVTATENERTGTEPRRPEHAWQALDGNPRRIEGERMTSEIDRDNEQFNKGVLHTVDLLAKALNATGWYAGDGSEDYDGDLTQTLFNVLIAAGLWDADENGPAKDADTAALKSIGEDVYWLLAKGRLRPTELLYAIQLLKPGTEQVIAEAEGNTIQECVRAALERVA